MPNKLPCLGVYVWAALLACIWEGIVTSYIIRRVLLMIPTLFLVSVAVFSLLRLSPQDPVTLLAESGNLVPEDIVALRAQLGLDEPAVTQYFKWLGETAQGDFGFSFTRQGQQAAVSDLIQRAIPVTLQLGIMAIFFAIIIAIPTQSRTSGTSEKSR